MSPTIAEKLADLETLFDDGIMKEDELSGLVKSILDKYVRIEDDEDELCCVYDMFRDDRTYYYQLLNIARETVEHLGLVF
jgi:hypothetical protein